ncbi:hypothetical protein POM88_042365 [Heracleum sosnowskyi]|uniref:HMG box domain-containing protein n=1 Tax=Heracleum sosnowskyi TaxID=360622 RepID=A0AAD8HGK3_9APIA|nr:hypothetical protein POM88_042365 [Heracleum sosnowskyi]
MATTVVKRMFQSTAPCSQIVRHFSRRSTSSRFTTGDFQFTGNTEDDGRDKMHWFIHTTQPQGSRDEMVASYIKLVTSVLGSEDEAKKAMYSVSTKYYSAIGVIVPEDVANKFRSHADVLDVLEDSYADPVSKDYGGEPIIDGQVVPYHPKHHDMYHRGQESLRLRMIDEGIHGYSDLEAYERMLKEDHTKKAEKNKDSNKPKRPPRRSTSSRLITSDFQFTRNTYVPPEDDGRDKMHWFIHTKEPLGSREKMVASYINLVASVLGSEDEAKKAMYSVSTKYYFAIGVIVPEDVANKFRSHPKVLDVLEDSYVDPVSKDYGGEPIIDGRVVPYHPKHHDLYHRGQESIRQGMIEEGIDGFPALEAYERMLKKIKDSNKPKRPPGAFFLFMESFREQFKQQNPNVKGVAAMGKAGGERWRSMTCEDKAPYLCKAEQMKMDYQKKIKVYEDKQAREIDEEESTGWRN